MDLIAFQCLESEENIDYVMLVNVLRYFSEDMRQLHGVLCAKTGTYYKNIAYVMLVTALWYF